MAKAKTQAAQKIDPESIKELKAKIAADERTLFAEFQESLKAKREKAMAAVLEPLRAEQTELQARVDEDQKRLREIESEINEITGDKITRGRKPGTGTKRERRSPEALKADAEKVLAFIKKNPGEKASAITAATGVIIKPPLNPKKLVEKYIEGAEVEATGKKAGTTYSAA